MSTNLIRLSDVSFSFLLVEFRLKHGLQIEDAIWEEAFFHERTARINGTIIIPIACGAISARWIEKYPTIDCLARSIQCIARQTITDYLPHYELQNVTYLTEQQEDGRYQLTYRIKLSYIELFGM
jgi:hypothetical protein